MKIINLFAGPCTGKTTLTYELMLRMKRMGLKCELIPDLPRDDVFSESWKRLNDHLLQLTQLQHRLNMLEGTGVEYVVMESPILMRMAYAQNEPSHITELIEGLHKEQDSLNVNLIRNPGFKYDQTGRDQTEAEAIERSRVTTELVERYIPNALTVMAGVRAGSYVLKELGFEDEISRMEFANIAQKDLVKALPVEKKKQFIIECESMYPYAGRSYNGFVAFNAHDAQDWEIKNGIEGQAGNTFAKKLYQGILDQCFKVDLMQERENIENRRIFYNKEVNGIEWNDNTIRLFPFHSKKWDFNDIENAFIDCAKNVAFELDFDGLSVGRNFKEKNAYVTSEEKKNKPKNNNLFIGIGQESMTKESVPKRKIK